MAGSPVVLKGESPERPIAATAAGALLALALVGVILKGVIDLGASPPLPRESVIHRALPGTHRFERFEDPFPHYLAYDANGDRRGAVVLTGECPPSLRGYMGVIHQAVGITSRGVMARVVPYNHNETPYYMAMILNSDLMAELANVDLGRTYPEPDTVTGATVSSRTMIRDARSAAILAARTLFGVETAQPAEKPGLPSVPWQALLLAVSLVLSITAARSGSPRWLREGTIALNLLVVGILLNTPLTLSATSRLMTLNFPGWGNIYLLLILLYLVISLPIFGRSYCRLVCPFGALQHLSNRWWPWKVKPNVSTASLLPPFRKAFLALLLILSVPLGMKGFSQVEPFYSLFSFSMTPLVWISVTVIIIICLFWRRFWCNAFCPTGTILALLSRALRPGKGKLDESV